MQRNMDRSGKSTTAFVFSAIALFVLLVGCARTPDEERIRAALESMQNAAEARRPADVLEHVADDFTGNNGEVDRASLAQLLKFQLLSRQSVGVASGPVEIVIDDDRATAKFDVTLSDSSGRWVPGGSETYRIVSGWRREGSNWLCYNATWTSGER